MPRSTDRQYEDAVIALTDSRVEFRLTCLLGLPAEDRKKTWDRYMRDLANLKALVGGE